MKDGLIKVNQNPVDPTKEEYDAFSSLAVGLFSPSLFDAPFPILGSSPVSRPAISCNSNRRCFASSISPSQQVLEIIQALSPSYPLSQALHFVGGQSKLVQQKPSGSKGDSTKPIHQQGTVYYIIERQNFEGLKLSKSDNILCAPHTLGYLWPRKVRR